MNQDETSTAALQHEAGQVLRTWIERNAPNATAASAVALLSQIDRVIAKAVQSATRDRVAPPEFIDAAELIEGEDEARAGMASRLKSARKRAGYRSAAAAARALGVPNEQYKSHESGGRGIKRTAVSLYARTFGVPAEWIERGINPPDWCKPKNSAESTPPFRLEERPGASG